MLFICNTQTLLMQAIHHPILKHHNGCTEGVIERYGIVCVCERVTVYVCTCAYLYVSVYAV